MVPEDPPKESHATGAPGVEAVAEKPTADPSVVLIEIPLVISPDDPAVAVTTPKPKGGVTVSSGAASVLTVTGMITVAFPVPLLYVTITLPVQNPAVIPVVATLTDIVAAVTF